MIGKVISHYKILETICAGIIDVIYKIEETKLERHVALKLLPLVFAADSNTKERFMRDTSRLCLYRPIYSKFNDGISRNNRRFIGKEPSVFRETTVTVLTKNRRYFEKQPSLY